MATTGRRAATTSSRAATTTCHSEAILRLVGYWFAPGPPAILTLPRPQRLVDPRAPGRRATLAHLRAGRVYETYPRSSYCRFRCGATAREMGRRELTDGIWIWPEGLAHYVEAHAVRLPPALLAGGRARPGPEDLRAWRRWARAQGACLPLDPAWSPLPDDAGALARRGDQLLVYRRRHLLIVSRRTGAVLARARDDDEPALDDLVR